MADLRASIPAILWTAGTLLVGVLLALFFVFRTLFTDGPSSPWHPEYLFAHALNVAVYGAGGFALLRWSPGPALLAALLLPGVVVVALYTEPRVPLRTVTACAVVLGAGAGAWLGSWRRASS